MSSARHAVHRADNFTGFGKRPDLTPSHQLVLPRGITLNTCVNRKNPVSGISCISTVLLAVPTSRRLFHTAFFEDGFEVDALQLLVVPLRRVPVRVVACHI